MRLFPCGPALIAAALAGACDSADPAGPSRPVAPPVLSAGGGLVPLDQFGVGLALPGVRDCRAAEYRQFDFWAGTWDVFNQANALVGTNLVTREIGGCALVEHWTSIGGGQGRSLNTYDAATGKWHQMWVASTGCPFSVILMEGGLEQGRMLLVGRREQPLGFLVGPPCGPAPAQVVTARTDRFRWSALPGGEVLQQVSGANNDAPLPPLADPETLQGLRYHPVEQVTPIPLPPQPLSFCPFRAAARQFDFMLGSWRVHRGSGVATQGTAVVQRSMAGCLIEERITGPGGYQGISYNTFDVFTQRWTRTYADNAGQWLFLTGGLVNGSMVLRGERPTGDGRTALVQVTWEPVAPGQVIQRWEYSLDGGATWQGTQTVSFDAADPA